MRQTFTAPPMDNMQQQQQQQHHQYHQIMTNLTSQEDQTHFQIEQPPYQPHQQYHQQPTYTTATTMQPEPITATSLNEHPDLGSGHYTPLGMPDGLSQYCSSSEVSSVLNFSSSMSASSSSSSSSSPSHDSDSPCLSPASSVSNISVQRPTPSIGVNLRVTGQCSQGGRKYMEDYFSVAYQQSENAKDLEYAFIGIYDGHGGAEAATFAKENLMMEIINQRLFWSDSDHDVLRAIREGYIATHYAMWRQQDKWPKTANGLPSTAGTTATVAFIRREKIYIGHVGDSGIVLGYQNENEHFWRAKQLTVDHKPESVDERARILNSGGKVVVKSGVPRVVWNRPRNTNHRGPIKHKTPVDEIPFLAVARSLGDLWSYSSQRNEFIVSPDPDVKVIPINPNTFRCLIFGTDGLWNVVSPQDAVNTVQEKEIINEHLQSQRGDSPNEGHQWTNPSKCLVDQALRTWSNKKMRADNTSVVTVILYPPGQGGHNNNLHPSSNIAPPPAFAQPASYGLEYSQLQAEVPGYNNEVTYQEMAMKYLPPEEYRNFNYYSEDSDTAEEGETDESEEEEAEKSKNFETLVNGAINHSSYAMERNTWNWEHNNGIHPSTSLQDNEGTTKYVDDEDKKVAEIEEEDEGDDGDNDVERTVVNNHGQSVGEQVVCVVEYQNYMNEPENTATESYINTFGESYNSVLNPGQADGLGADVDTKLAHSSIASAITPTNSNSNSNSNSSNCQSVSPPDLHALIEEQKLYQQQCMSEEDGYCLTKLETRREQQSCKSQDSQMRSAEGVEAFKIFHQQPNPHRIDSTAYTTNTERFYQQHAGFQQKPLELNSLLQQEREEEQQVAFERQQMQNITAYTCMQAMRYETEPTTSIYSSQPSTLEGKTSHIDIDPNELIEEVEATMEETTIGEGVSSVQINEISSSSLCGEMDNECEKFVSPSSQLSTPWPPKLQYEKHDVAHEGIYNNHGFKNRNEGVGHSLTKKSVHSRRASFKQNNNSCLPSAPSPITLNTSSTRPIIKRPKSFIYANVPNENVDRSCYPPQSPLQGSLAMSNSEIKMTCSGLLRTPPAATSTPMISRQLRSNTINCNSNAAIDYGKRTLRARNSLAKDMKSKSKPSIVQAALKYSHRKYIRSPTSVSLLAGNASVLMQEQLASTVGRRSLNKNNNGHNCITRSIKNTRSANTRTSLNQTRGVTYHLNLRSRQSSGMSMATNQHLLDLNSTPIGRLHGAASTSAATPSSPSAKTAAIRRRASLGDHRSLRSMHTRSSSRLGPSTQTSFSKTTRSQSAGKNLRAPPPSPKMINAAAVAVAAATRARSLLSQQQAAEVNGRRSVVAAVFGKRGNLRSNGLTTTDESGTSPSGAALSNANNIQTTRMRSASARQTLRGRVVKKFQR